MEYIHPQHWVMLHVGMILMITVAQMLVVYALSDSSNPPEGLGMFTIYFLAALVGWIGMGLAQGVQSKLAFDLGATASILTSYILYLAAVQRSGETKGRLALGGLCLLGVINIFVFEVQQVFVVPTIISILCYIATGIVSLRRSIKQRNVGDAIIATAAFLLVCATPAALYQVVVNDNTALAYAIALGARSWACTLISVGFLASVLIEYQQYLSHLATQDPLTKLLNRRGLEDTLQLSLAKASRQRLAIAAIAIDIDHFKKINDTFGHQAGDKVLRKIASVLKAHCRASDVVARTGGEEFLIVLTDTNLESAQTLAQRIRTKISDKPLMAGPYSISATISLGLAVSKGETTLDTLIQEADQALYLAKQGGRNRVATIASNPIHLSSRGVVKPPNA